MKKFCDVLKEKRIEKNMLKKDVANLFNWTPMYYGRYEKGDLLPNDKNIDMFAKFLEMTVEEVKKIMWKN